MAPDPAIVTDPSAVAPAFESWLSQRVALVPPLTVQKIAGGYAHLTYAVSDGAGARWALRHPPTGPVEARAHDVAREARILTALAGTGVPVPKVVGHCDDPDVIGVPFFVMEFVDGLVVRSPADAARLPSRTPAVLGASLVATLAAVHAVDIDEVGLGGLGRRDGYVARQLWRFGQQLSRIDRTYARDLVPTLERLHSQLSADIPQQTHTGLVHGDFRIDNTIVAPTGEVRAVLDWELTALGDPMADVGLFSVYWREEGEDDFGLPVPSAVSAFTSRSELLADYAQLTGRDLGRLPYYEALGQWKLACINVGVAARARAGVIAESADAILDAARRRAAHAQARLAVRATP